MVFVLQVVAAQKAGMTLQSPNKKIKVELVREGTYMLYNVMYNDTTVLDYSHLGLVRADADFSENLSLSSMSTVQTVTDNYSMLHGKKTICNYIASKRTFHCKNGNGQFIDIIFQVSNDGVAFRYYFPAGSKGIKSVTKESTTYNFTAGSKAWLQPMSVAKTGWQKSNPSYEEHYLQDIPVGTPSPLKAGWVYPALFQSNNTWVLITEAGLDSNYCATRLINDSASTEYSVGFPDPREVFTGGGLLPVSKLPWYSPWRIITVGSLQTIAESTLGTDLAAPAKKIDASFVKPGKASWSWINSKDDFIVYGEQKKYIDFAADMHWQYCLVDVNWNVKIGYDKMKELTDYAATKNVGMLVWYNSAGDWNTTPYQPRNMLLTHEQRIKEFGRLQTMGIKGVKIDFFGGDGQSMIKYYIEILEDAAKFKLLVNFHGATLPRGWARTYPNLLTTEAIAGFEMITFEQRHADVEANHCAMLPFTRNAFDPMDFTPMNLYKIQTRVKRKTTSTFELALSVLFLSGIQHYAESPDGMTHVPAFVKSFLQDLPNSWQSSKFIAGYPGKLAIIARKYGSQWYISGINGEAIEKNIALDLYFVKGKKATFIQDGKEELSFEQSTITIPANGKMNVPLQSNGGFVMVVE